jgi:hypothetical protein
MSTASDPSAHAKLFARLFIIGTAFLALGPANLPPIDADSNPVLRAPSLHAAEIDLMGGSSSTKAMKVALKDPPCTVTGGIIFLPLMGLALLLLGNRPGSGTPRRLKP